MQAQNDPVQFSTSQNLLILEHRQAVHHMLSVHDWIVLSIYTPNQHDSKPNFTKNKHSEANSPDKQQIKDQNEVQDITKLLSVLAIRTEAKHQGASTDYFGLLKEFKPKEAIGQIKMIHKQSRVQNIIEWDTENQYQEYDTQQQTHSHFLSQPKYFLILSYTKIELYTVSIFPTSTITLTQVFSSPFLIPFNIISLKRTSKSRTGQNHNQREHDIKVQKFLTKSIQQKYQIAMVGIDRSQTFWSGYYQIETNKRNLYLFKEFVIRPSQIRLKSKELQAKVNSKEDALPQKTLRRVKSAENIFEVTNKSIYLQRQEHKSQKQQLSSTHLVAANNSSSPTHSNQSQMQKSPQKQPKSQQKQWKSPQKQWQRSYKSPESMRQDQVSFDQTISSHSDSKSTNRLRQVKEPSVRLTRESRETKTQKKVMNRNQLSEKIFPKQLKFDTKIQLCPSLLYSQSPKHTSQQSPKSSKPITRPQFSYNHGSIKCNPPVEHVHHFYSQTLVPVKIEQRGSLKGSESSKKRFRKEEQLMVLVGYLNVVVLVNVEREEVVARVGLDRNAFIVKSITINNMFGMFSAVILTKTFNSPNKQCQSQKLIKLTIDTINHQQLGMGLQPIKMPSLTEKQQIIDCRNIYKQNLVEMVDAMKKYMNKLQAEEEQEMKMKQSYDQVLMDAIREEDDNFGMQPQQTIKKLKDSYCAKNDPTLEDRVKEDEEDKYLQSKVGQSLNAWLSVPLAELQYCFIVATSTPRLLLYNHLTSATKVLYCAQRPKPTQLQPSTLTQHPTQSIHSMFSINKLSTTPLYIQPIFDTNSSQQPSLSCKIAILYSTDINHFIAKCSQPSSSHNQNHHQQLSLIKELKQLTF